MPRRLSRWLGVTETDLVSWYRQLRSDSDLARELRRRWIQTTHRPVSQYLGGIATGGPNDVLYLAVRALKPKVIVETGVAAGFSSAYILSALADNGSGELYSIDAGNADPLGLASETGHRDLSYSTSLGPIGFAIPERLRGRWKLTVGLSSKVLPLLLKTVGSVDIFWHDSEHSYSNMMFEFRAVWPHVPVDGVVFSDDIVQNRSFSDFSTAVSAVPFYFFGRGGLRKRTPSSADREGPGSFREAP
jgi:hypothetical protein